HRAAAAIAQGLRSMAPARSAALAIALYPAAAHGFFPALGAEAVSELGRWAAPAFPLDPRSGIDLRRGAGAVRRDFLRRHPATGVGGLYGFGRLLGEFEELSDWVRDRAPDGSLVDAPPCRVVRAIGLRTVVGGDPCAAAWTALLEAGIPDLQALRERVVVPEVPLVAVPAPASGEGAVESPADGPTRLEELLMLGLSSATAYDPARPVLWNRASLGRRLLLLDMRGFHGLG
ncbi:MAG: hypothetical protein ACKO5K_00395, partial [Armatimonadota bacterium]